MRNKTLRIVNEFDKITGSVLTYFASDQGFFISNLFLSA